MAINKNKNFLYLIYLGVISTFNFLLEIIRLFSVGFFKLFDIFFNTLLEIIFYCYVGFNAFVSVIGLDVYYILKYCFIGFSSIFIRPITKALKNQKARSLKLKEEKERLRIEHEKKLKEEKAKKTLEEIKNRTKKKETGVLYERKNDDTLKTKKRDLIFEDKSSTKIEDVKEEKLSFFQKLFKNSSLSQFKKNHLDKEGKAILDDLTEEKRSKEKVLYKYKVKDPNTGKFITGIFGGYSKLDVQTYLLNEGYEIYRIETSKWINLLYGRSSFSSRKLSNKDLIFWLTQLSTYIKSGIPLTESVKILANQMGKRTERKRIFQSIVYELTMGESFSKALEKQGTIFPGLLINMLRAAEAAGNLEETLDDMANYYDEIEKTRKQMISAMMYPSIIVIFAICVITFIMLYVVPQFVKVYAQMGTKVVGITKAIVNLSVFLKNNALILILAVVIIITIIVLLYKNVKAFRTFLQIIAMKIPVFGKIIIYNELTIFTKTFASLLKNNVYITDSIDILSKITSNEIYKKIMFNTIANIAKGEKISESFKNQWAVPDVAYYMIVTGESTGELSEMMATVSDYYQEMHRSVINNLKALIEPIMIVLLAVIVGVILLAVIIPMFNIYENISL